MAIQEYDKKSVESIYKYSCQLTGKTLAQAVKLPDDVVNQKNRGDLGRLVEIHFFVLMMCLNLEGVVPPSPVKMVRLGLVSKSGKAIFPSA